MAGVHFQQAHDMGNVAEVFVNGVCDIQEIAPGVVRVSFFSKRRDGHDGAEQQQIADYQIWQTAQLAEALNLLGWAIADGLTMKRPKLAYSAGPH
jgi:hypothetical protein